MLLTTLRATRIYACTSKYIQFPERVTRCFSVSRPLRHAPTQDRHYQQHQHQPQHQNQNQQHLQEEVVTPVVHGKPNEDPNVEEAEVVFEITEKNLEQSLMGSQTPIIVDVYSHNELNSKAQSDKLIAAAKNSQGIIRVGRLNADRFPSLLENMNLSMDLLPAALFIYGGRQFAQYFGKGEIIDNAELDKRINVLYKVSGLVNSKGMLKSAENTLASGDIEGAQKIYTDILHNKQLKMEATAMAGLAMCAIQSKNIEEAKELLDVIKTNFKDDLESSYVKKALAALELAEASGTSSEEELKAKLTSNPTDIEAKYALAVLYSTTNKADHAINEALEIIKIDKQFKDQAARKLLLQIFEMLGADHPLTVKGRKRLSSLWFL